MEMETDLTGRKSFVVEARRKLMDELHGSHVEALMKAVMAKGTYPKLLSERPTSASTNCVFLGILNLTFG